MRKACFSFLFAFVVQLLFVFELPAQITIHGIVMDGDSAVLGAIAAQSGKTQHVTADANGRFSINASKGVTVIVSALGYNDVRYIVPKDAATDMYITFKMDKGKAIVTQAPASLEQKGSAPVDVFKQGKALFDRKQYSEAFQLFKQAASEGDSNGYYYMGLCYQRGLGVNMDAYKAFSMCDKAADMKNPEALYWMFKAFSYYYVFYPKDFSIGISWLKQAADLGHADACEQYAQFLVSGDRGVTLDVVAGMKYFDKAVAGGSVDAYCTLAQYYYFGRYVQKDLAKSSYYSEKLKASHSARAYQQLAVMYKDGSIGVQSDEKSNELLRKASDLGDASASAKLGNQAFYQEGDYNKAVPLLKKAMEQGDFRAGVTLSEYYYKMGDLSKMVEALIDCGHIKSAYDNLGNLNAADRVRYLKRITDNPPIQFSFIGEANNWLGNHYFNGDGVAKSYAEAVKYYRKGAENGNGWAAHNLASCYVNGNGVKKDNSSVFYWLKKAAETGLTVAQKDLGYCYFKGIGTSINYSESYRNFKKAAEAGDAEAQYMLAYHYGKGWGTSLDKNQCVAWLEKSAANGFEPAKNELPNVRAALQRSQNVNAMSMLDAMGTASFDSMYQNAMASIASSANAELNRLQNMANDVISNTPPEAWALVDGTGNVDNNVNYSQDNSGASPQDRMVGTCQAFGLSQAFGSTVTHNQSFQIYQDANGYYVKEAYGVKRYLYRNSHQDFFGYNVSSYNWCLGSDPTWFFRL